MNEHERRVSEALAELEFERSLHSEASEFGVMWIRYRLMVLRRAVIMAEANGVRCV